MREYTQKIVTEFIRLDAFLKLTGSVPTGGQAKTWIQEGHILVNGEQCIQRGKKLYNGDTVSIVGEDTILHVVSENA